MWPVKKRHGVIALWAACVTEASVKAIFRPKLRASEVLNQKIPAEHTLRSAGI
jgi:hypothetical protein